MRVTQLRAGFPLRRTPRSRRVNTRRYHVTTHLELESYRTIVRTEPEAGPTVGRWITDTAQERQRLETILGNKHSTRLAKDDIKPLVASLRDITATLAAADPADKAAVYEEMGIDLTYHQNGRVLAESRPRVANDGVGGTSPRDHNDPTWRVGQWVAV
jgi:hypothetical protein